jgi:hypothetical protein
MDFLQHGCTNNRDVVGHEGLNDTLPEIGQAFLRKELYTSSELITATDSCCHPHGGCREVGGALYLITAIGS